MFERKANLFERRANLLERRAKLDLLLNVESQIVMSLAQFKASTHTHSYTLTYLRLSLHSLTVKHL
jgi:hypothetical protein